MSVKLSPYGLFLCIADAIVIPYSNKIPKTGPFFTKADYRFLEEVRQLGYIISSECAIVNSYDSCFKKIILANVPKLMPDIPRMLNAVHNTYMSCFKKAYIFGMKSIAVPIIGLGNEYYSDSELIKKMFGAIRTFEKMIGAEMDVTVYTLSADAFDRIKMLFEKYKATVLPFEEEIPVPIPTPSKVEEGHIKYDFKTKTTPEWIRYYAKRKKMNLSDCYRGVMSKTNFFKMMKRDIKPDKYKLIAIGLQMGLTFEEMNNVLTPTGEVLDPHGLNGKDLFIIGALNNHFTIEKLNSDLRWQGLEPLPYKKSIK